MLNLKPMMMNEQELEKLCMEYSSHCMRSIHDGDIPDSLYDAWSKNHYSHAMSVISWLAKTHCIVPKSEVEEKHDYAKGLAAQTQYDYVRERAKGQVRILEVLFPHLFEERREG